MDARTYLDFCAPTGMIMLACVRLGCFLQGCCQGIDLWIRSTQVILPTQLMEVTLDLFLADFILKLETGKRFEKGRYFVAMGMYGVIRFCLEFLRETARGVWIFSNGQIFSLIWIAVMAGYLWTEMRENG